MATTLITYFCCRRRESFDYYHGPITSTYGQVWWGAHPGGDLPKEVVERFAGKVMAVVGIEMDQVRRKGDKDTDGSLLQEDVSLPINVAYNHHHGSLIIGRGAELKTMSPDEGEPFHPQNHVGRGWGIRNSAMGAVL